MTRNCLFADTPCQLVHEDKQGPNSWTLPVNLATFLNRCCQLNCVFMCDVVSSSHGLPRLNDRSSNRQKPPVCINPAIFMQQEKKNQVFAWLFYYEVIKFLHMTYFKVKSQMTWFEWGSKMNKGIRRYDCNRRQWFVQIKMLTLQ